LHLFPDADILGVRESSWCRGTQVDAYDGEKSENASNGSTENELSGLSIGDTAFSPQGDIELLIVSKTKN
jgi:hypothetical protein